MQVALRLGTVAEHVNYLCALQVTECGSAGVQFATQQAPRGVTPAYAPHLYCLFTHVRAGRGGRRGAQSSGTDPRRV